MRMASRRTKLIPGLAWMCALSALGGGGAALAHGMALDLSLRAGPAALIAKVSAKTGVQLNLQIDNVLVLGRGT